MKKIVLALALSAPIISCGQFYWEQRADLPTTGLWGPSFFTIGNKGYVVSGRTNGLDVTDVWMYDADDDSWTARAPIPAPRRYGAGFAINGRGYVACGIDGGTHLNDLWEYDPVTDSWSNRADFPGTPRYGTHYFALNSKGYVGSGNTGSSDGPYVSDMFAYDPTLDAWSQMADMPGLARYGTSTITASGKAFVFGGLMSNQQHSGDIYEYDPSADDWELRPPIPGATRTYAMALSYSWDGVIAAGKSGAGVNVYDGFRYLPGSNGWTAIPDYPGEAGWVGATLAISGRSFGGLGYILAADTDHNDWWELVKDGVGISEVYLGRGTPLRVSPNPMRPGDALHFHEAELTGSDWDVVITSMDGNEVLTDVVRAGHIFDCPLLATGAYCLRLRAKDGTTFTGRFIVAENSR
ncbi:MAG: hypothetical protein IPL52_11110 [Flavobacteriales bacterium]|nr:hypothetical protein [Flavobacteriales bacterium]